MLSHPKKLVSDVTVAGVSGGGTRAGEKIPRAWIVLTERGKEMGVTAVIQELESWHQMHLSKFKWLRGGIEIVPEVSQITYEYRLSADLEGSFLNQLREKRSGACCRSSMKIV